MEHSLISYFYLIATIVTTVFSQLIIKWRVSNKFAQMVFPDGWGDRFYFLLSVIFDPFIFMGLCATFISGLCWMATMTKFEISFAYPFTSLGFVLVLLLSVLLLGETLNMYKVAGVILIMLGVFVSSRG